MPSGLGGLALNLSALEEELRVASVDCVVSRALATSKRMSPPPADNVGA